MKPLKPAVFFCQPSQNAHRFLALRERLFMLEVRGVSRLEMGLCAAPSGRGMALHVGRFTSAKVFSVFSRSSRRFFSQILFAGKPALTFRRGLVGAWRGDSVR